MLFKNLLIVTVLAINILSSDGKPEKKIELDDIEQDNLNSERQKTKTDDNYSQTPSSPEVNTNYGRSPVTHQYDVEENNVQDNPAIVYATPDTTYNTEQQQYAEVAENQEQTPEKYETHYQNLEQDPGLVQNYVSPMPMQIIYLHTFDPSSTNQVNNYQNQYQQMVPAIYYQPQEAPNYQQPEKHKYEQNVQEEAPKQNQYYAIPNQLFHIAPNFILPMPYQQQIKNEVAQNYPGYHHHQQYLNPLAENQHLKYLPAPLTNHVNHVPQVLPQYAHEVSRPIYSHISGKLVQESPEHQTYTRPHQKPFHHDSFGFGAFVKRKPSSLLESYIPSSIQIEYLKRGLSKDPLSTYDAVAYSQGFPLKNFERGFLPNQMYPTGAGGVTFGHFKRAISPKPK